MFQTPRGLVCYSSDQQQTLPYEPCIKEAPMGKLKTFGREPTDLAEEREDLSLSKRKLTKLQKIQAMRAKAPPQSRDISPASAASTDISTSSRPSSKVSYQKKIPDYTPEAFY